MSAQSSFEPRVRDTWRELAQWLQAQFASTWRDMPFTRDPAPGSALPPPHVLYPRLIAVMANKKLADISTRNGVTHATSGWRVVAEFRRDLWMLDVSAEDPGYRRYSIEALAKGAPHDAR